MASLISERASSLALFGFFDFSFIITSPSDRSNLVLETCPVVFAKAEHPVHLDRISVRAGHGTLELPERLVEIGHDDPEIDPAHALTLRLERYIQVPGRGVNPPGCHQVLLCLLYTSDAADDLLCVDLG